MQKTILITGASGFIGQSFLEYIRKKKNFKIYAIYNLNKPLKKFKDIKYLSYDLTKNNLKKLPRKIDCIVHLAGSRDTFLGGAKAKKQLILNKKICKNIINYSEIIGCEKIIFMSSVYIYSGLTVKKKHAVNIIKKKPKENLGISKFNSEKTFIKFSRFRNNKVLILRLFTAYGKLSSSTQLIPSLIKKFKSQDKIIRFHSSIIRRDFIHISDVCSAMYKSIELIFKMKINHKIFDLGFGKSVNIMKIISLISNQLQHKKTLRFVNQKKKMKGDLNHYSNIRKTCKELNWKPKIKINTWINNNIK